MPGVVTRRNSGTHIDKPLFTEGIHFTTLASGIAVTLEAREINWVAAPAATGHRSDI
jgi:hypothetical protein